MAFLYGWSILTVITSGAIAALCLAFARYAALLFGMDISYQVPIGLAALFFVTLVNITGVRWSALFSSSMTMMKVVGIAVIVIVCLLFGHDLLAHIDHPASSSHPISMGLALIGVLWSYGGWHHASYVGGEVHDAKKILPRALISGALIVTIVYILVNVAYLSVLTIDEISGSPAVASDAMSKITPFGGMLVAILIAVSTFGTAGIYTLSAPRIYYTMGADKVFFPWLADIHPKFGTPLKAIVLQSAWAGVLLLFWGTFESLATYVVFMDWIFMTLAAVGLFVFRKRSKAKDPDGYKVPLYPVVPLIFIGISIWFLFSTLIGRPVQAVAGIVLMLIGLPVYYYFTRSKAT